MRAMDQRVAQVCVPLQTCHRDNFPAPKVSLPPWHLNGKRNGKEARLPHPP
jgi:hypothetical protein